MKNLLKQLTGRFLPALLITALFFTTSVSAASIRPSVESITLEKGSNIASFDIILTAEESFAGAEFGLKPSSDDVTFQSLTFLDVEGEPTVRTIKDGILYFGFFSGSNKYEAKTYRVARLTYQYTGTSQRTISLTSSKIVTIDGNTNTTVGDTSSAPFTVTLTRAGTSTSGGGGSSGGSGGSGGSGSGTAVQKPDITVGEGGSISQSEDGTSVTITPDKGYHIADVTKNGVSVGQTDKLDGLKTGDKVVISFEQTAEETDFTDIQNHWAKSYIETAVSKGLFTGVSSAIFSPDTSTSRAMLVTVLYRMEGSPTISQPAGFTDLHSDWYADSVAWGAANGIVKGYDEKTFGPDDLVTREQIAAILHRYAQYKGYAEGETGNLTPFTDASQISDWAHEDMIWAVGQKLITGRTADTLAPKATATRAEAAKILVTFTEQQAI